MEARPEEVVSGKDRSGERWRELHLLAPVEKGGPPLAVAVAAT
jgi:hypothetical protein